MSSIKSASLTRLKEMQLELAQQQQQHVANAVQPVAGHHGGHQGGFRATSAVPQAIVRVSNHVGSNGMARSVSGAAVSGAVTVEAIRPVGSYGNFEARENLRHPPIKQHTPASRDDLL